MSAVDLKLDERRKPGFSVPALSCDTHCHIFGPGEVFPYAPGRTYTPDDAPKETLAALHDFLGLDRAVLVQGSAHGVDNTAMLDALAWAPERFRGVALADDTTTDADLEAMHEAGVRGVRFNFVKHIGAPDPALIGRMLDRVRPLGWHVVLHVDAHGIDALPALVESFDMPFVIDHMGRVPSAEGVDQPAFATLLEIVRAENCWIKVSGADRIAFPPYADAVPFASALVAANPDRCLWGTDFPHPNASHVTDEADLIELIPLIAPDPVQQHKLLVDNPARLYGF